MTEMLEETFNLPGSIKLLLPESQRWMGRVDTLIKENEISENPTLPMEQVLNSEENQIEPPREHLLKMRYWAAVGGSQRGT